MPAPTPAPQMSAQSWAMLLALSVLWGGTFFLVEIALTGLPPLTLVLLRVALAAAALWALIGIGGHARPRGWALWRAGAIMGLLNNALPFTLIFWGQTQISGGMAAILNATTPLFTVLVAHLALSDEKASAIKWAAVGLGFLGVLVIAGPNAAKGLTDGLWGQTAVLGAAASYACAGVYGRRFRALNVPPLSAAVMQLTASSALLLPLALILDQPWRLPLPGPGVWATVGALALMSTALAYLLYFAILARAGATNLLLVTFLIPVTAIALGASFLGEALSGPQMIGMGLIGLGLVVMDGRLLHRARPPRRR